MFEPDEWTAAYILNKLKLPDRPRTLNEVVRLVANLGGFLARTGDGEPGVKTIWLGIQRILDFAAGIRFSRELQAQGDLCITECLKCQTIFAPLPRIYKIYTSGGLTTPFFG